jgi:hypothetical protein
LFLLLFHIVLVLNVLLIATSKVEKSFTATKLLAILKGNGRFADNEKEIRER